MRDRRKRTIAATCCSRVEVSLLALWEKVDQLRGARLRRMRGLSQHEGAVAAETTPHPSPLRSGTFSHKGRREQKLRAPRQRAVDHVDGVLHAIHRDERTEARALLLAEQHLIEHVEPVERNAGPAILALLHLIQKRLAAADLVDHVLDVFGARSG